MIRDLDFILTLDIDWVALSFVQRPEDIEELRKLTGGKKVKVRVSPTESMQVAHFSCTDCCLS